MENDTAAGKRSDRIKTWFADKPGKYDIFLVLLLYIAAVAVYYLINNFPKRIDIYSDELLYYTIAESLHNGKGILAMNAHISFNKIVYPLVLSPFFGIEDPVLRVHMISLFNSALILTSLFFVYLIGKEIELNRGSMALALAVTVLWPDLTYSITFMSENLNWPLTLLAIYLWLKSKKGRHNIAYSIAFGAVCYLGYLCKNIFLALLLSAVLFEAAYPIAMYLISRKDAPEKKLRGYFDKRSLIGCGISLALFVVCYVLGSILLYGGGDHNISSSLNTKLYEYSVTYTVLYLLFSFVYYLAASFIAVLVMPIAYSAANFKRMDTSTRKIFSLLSIYLVISCAMVAYTISIKEDIGAVAPRLHMRYLGFILLLLVVVFYKVLQTKIDEGKISSKNQLLLTLAAVFLACIICQGSDDSRSETDQTTMNVYNSAAEVISAYTNSFLGREFYVIKFASLAIISLIVIVVYYYRNKKRSERAAACIFSVFMLMVCFQNFRLETDQMRKCYRADEEMISDILSINQYLDNAEGDKQILYICSNTLNDEQKILTTYFDHMGGLCQSSSGHIYPYLAHDGKTIDVPNAQFQFGMSGASYVYDHIDKIDYIITDDTTQTELRGVSRIGEAGGKYFMLYKNLDPATVEVVPEVYVGEPLKIKFKPDNDDMDTYCRYGLSAAEENYAMTNGDRASFRIPVVGEYDSVKVSIEVSETYNNTPQSYTIVQKDNVLANGALTGKGEINFTAPVKKGYLEFDIVCSTAVGENDEEFELAIMGNITRFAFRISGITVE